MEYLMTYGWAILIIGIVASALLYIVFSGNSGNVFQPRASPGSCIVYASNQQGNLGLSTTVKNLEGACNNELPLYVAEFNGAGSYINITGSPALTSGAAYTVVLWIHSASQTGVFYSTWDTNANGYQLSSHSGDASFGSGSSGDEYSNTIVTDGKWHQVAGVFNSSGLGSIYVDGVKVLSASTSNTISSQNVQIGRQSGATPYYYNVSIANVQVYNTSLSSNAIAALYTEGIGGAPVALPWLAGWWPLNGNANDYSGNNNNGVASGVAYTTSWSSGYAAP